MARATNAKIEKLSRALFPRNGIKDVANLVATVVKRRGQDGHAKIWRPEGNWGWFASPGGTVVTPGIVVLSFPSSDHDSAHARDDIYRQLEDATLSVMSEDEIIAAMARIGVDKGGGVGKKTPAQLQREIDDALAGPSGGLSPHLFRRARWDLYDSSGRWVGDIFAHSAEEALRLGGGPGVASARLPGVGGR